MNNRWYFNNSSQIAFDKYVYRNTYIYDLMFIVNNLFLTLKIQASTKEKNIANVLKS
jgi:hypothetical protein